LLSLGAYPFNSLGHIAFAFAEILGLFVGLVVALKEAFGAAAGGLAFSVSFALPFGMGNKNMVTLGSVLSSFNLISMGKLPLASG
jgi:hypothetical protein